MKKKAMKYERRNEIRKKYVEIDKEKWGGRTEGHRGRKKQEKKRKRGGEASGGLDPSGGQIL